MILPNGEDFDDDLGKFVNIFHFFVIFEIFDVFGFLTYLMCYGHICREGSSTWYVSISPTWA